MWFRGDRFRHLEEQGAVSPNFRSTLGFAVWTQGSSGGGPFTYCTWRFPASAPVSQAVHSAAHRRLGAAPGMGATPRRPALGLAGGAPPPTPASAPPGSLLRHVAAAALLCSKCPSFVTWSTNVFVTFAS